MIFRKGCKVPFPEKILESYCFFETYFKANVGEDKIKELLCHFISIHNEHLFFILELSSNKAAETEIRFGTVSALHKDIYYIDGCNQKDALTIFEKVSSILINDGLCSFGFGCHNSHDEIMVGKYNVVILYTKNSEKYQGFFEKQFLFKNSNSLLIFSSFFVPKGRNDIISHCFRSPCKRRENGVF